MIRIENLHKSYGDLILFEGINFALNERERLGVVGRNGHASLSPKITASAMSAKIWSSAITPF
jgi:ABC-type uncharacterized transport system ATPase subunit